MIEFVFLGMIFGHVLDDYFLQSAFLANGKQHDWWKKNAPDPLYKHDYIVCLLMHAASWSFCMMFPIAWYFYFQVTGKFIAMYIANLLIHAFVDHLKANLKMINLVQDQMIHMLQIMFTFAIVIFL